MKQFFALMASGWLIILILMGVYEPYPVFALALGWGVWITSSIAKKYREGGKY